MYQTLGKLNAIFTVEFLVFFLPHLYYVAISLAIYSRKYCVFFPSNLKLFISMLLLHWKHSYQRDKYQMIYYDVIAGDIKYLWA